MPASEKLQSESIGVIFPIGGLLRASDVNRLLSRPSHPFGTD